MDFGGDKNSAHTRQHTGKGEHRQVGMKTQKSESKVRAMGNKENL